MAKVKYMVEVGCEDCSGIDPYGCFDGGMDTIKVCDVKGWDGLTTDEGLKVALFDTPEDAEDAFHEYADGAPWFYYIAEVDIDG